MLRDIILLLVSCGLQKGILATNLTSSQVLRSNHSMPYNGSATWNSSISQVTSCKIDTKTNYVGTIDKYRKADSIGGYEDYCALWNSSCSGDLDTAFRNFEKDIAWFDDGILYDCSQDVYMVGDPPSEKSRSLYTQLSNYAQSPQCTSRYRDIHCPDFSISSQSQCRASVFPTAPCCGPCRFQAAVVDLLYWPSESSDTSCLSIVDLKGQDPRTTMWHDSYGTSNTYIYWGCTGMSRAPNGSMSYGFAETAYQASIGTLTYKVNIRNPWENSIVSCVQATASSQYSNFSAASIRVRAHSSVNGTKGAENATMSLSRVVVSDGHA